MPMNTYPIEEKCVLLITRRLAAAILTQNAVEDNDPAFPAGIREALDAGLTPWKCAMDPGLMQILTDGGWADTSDAYDLIQAAGESDAVYCSEFTGRAVIPDEFARHHKSMDEIRFDDEYIACLIPMKPTGMFKQAYQSPDELIKEYRDRLGDLAGPDIPIETLIRDVSGVHVC